MKTRTPIRCFVFILSAVGFSMLSAPRASAESPGDQVLFIVPAGIGVTPGPDGDVVIATGRSQGTIDTTGCASGAHHVQSAVYVDPGSGNRATRTARMIVLSQTDPVRNGTRIGNLVQSIQCAIGDDNYDRFFGIVE